MLVLNLIVALIAGLIVNLHAVEFTFELPDNKADCFYEEIKHNSSAILWFQVTSGGQRDVDVTFKNPQKVILYEGKRVSLHRDLYNLDTIGAIHNETALYGIKEHAAVLTQMESSLETLHKTITDISDAQITHRNRFSGSGTYALKLNNAVNFYSILIGAAVIIIGVGQVFILRSFFTERKSSHKRWNARAF